jgi:LPS export ABC transporter protein LptC
MNKKTVIQILMIFLIIVISLLFFLKYFRNSIEPLEEKVQIKNLELKENNSSSFIEDINYISNDSKGNSYKITSEKAEIDANEPDVMFLENVISYVYFKDQETMKITSNFGKYNSKNYDTIFSQNVIITYPGHQMTGEYFDFSFLDNLGTMSTNVIYIGEKNKLLADRVEINLTTKDTKIFMDSINKKVFIEGTK